MKFWMNNFLLCVSLVKMLSSDCHWWLVSISAGNGLVPSDNKPLPQPMYTRSMSPYGITRPQWVNTLRPRQNGRHFADDTFKLIFINENVRISIKISLKFVPWGPINNISALVQIMARRRSGDKPLSETMMVSSLTHICVTWPQWVKYYEA